MTDVLLPCCACRTQLPSRRRSARSLEPWRRFQFREPRLHIIERAAHLDLGWIASLPLAPDGKV